MFLGTSLRVAAKGPGYARLSVSCLPFSQNETARCAVSSTIPGAREIESKNSRLLKVLLDTAYSSIWLWPLPGL